jgi:hypothetical protein
MLSGDAILLLLSIVAGLLLGIMAWGFLRVQWRGSRNDWIEPGDNVSSDEASSSDETLLGLLVVAAFTLGAFVVYALLGLRL